MVESERPKMKVQYMRFLCCITKATNTHSDYIILSVLHCDNGYVHALLCYVICAISVLLNSLLAVHLCVCVCVCVCVCILSQLLSQVTDLN